VGIAPQTVTAGSVLAANSTWRGGTPVESEASLSPIFFAQVLDANNQIVGQYDGEGGPQGFTEGQDTPVRMGVPVPVGTIPGDYRVIMGVYDRDTGQRFVSAYGDAVTVASVQVIAPPVPPPVEAISLPNGRFFDESFGSLALVAARANKLGSDHAPETPVRPGEPLSVLLYWQIREREAVLPRLTLRLVDGAGQTRTEWEIVPADGQYPLEQWRVGDLIRDPQTYFVPSDLPPGGYEAVLTDGRQTVAVATMTIGQ
jgi:hypothetical protein